MNKLYSLSTSELLYFSSVPSQNFCHVCIIFIEERSIGEGKGKPLLTSQSH